MSGPASWHLLTPCRELVETELLPEESRAEVVDTRQLNTTVTNIIVITKFVVFCYLYTVMQTKVIKPGFKVYNAIHYWIIEYSRPYKVLRDKGSLKVGMAVLKNHLHSKLNKIYRTVKPPCKSNVTFNAFALHFRNQKWHYIHQLMPSTNQRFST